MHLSPFKFSTKKQMNQGKWVFPKILTQRHKDTKFSLIMESGTELTKSTLPTLLSIFVISVPP
jgi:hypothetical protein